MFNDVFCHVVLNQASHKPFCILTFSKKHHLVETDTHCDLCDWVMFDRFREHLIRFVCCGVVVCCHQHHCKFSIWIYSLHSIPFILKLLQLLTQWKIMCGIVWNIFSELQSISCTRMWWKLISEWHLLPVQQQFTAGV